MGNYTILGEFENPRRGRQARNLTTNVPKILDLKSSSEQIFSRKLSLGAPVKREQAYKLSIGELILVGVGGGVRRNVPGLNFKTRYHHPHRYLYTVVNIRHY